MTVEHGVHRARGRGVDVGVEPAELLANLRSAPTRLLLFERDDELLDLKGQPIGVPIGPPRAVGEPLEPHILVALKDLVAGLARDPERPAQRGHFLALKQPGDESNAFIHLVTLLPRHPEACPKCRIV